MDRPQPVSAELISDLSNLRTLNRYFGSYRLVRHFLRRWLRPNDNLCIIDLATGSGDIPRLVVEFARRIGASVRIDAVDLQASTIRIAQELSKGFPEIHYHCADIHNFGSTQSYDLVLFSLALHHFTAEEAIALLRRCRELSRGQCAGGGFASRPLGKVWRRSDNHLCFSRSDDAKRRARLDGTRFFVSRAFRTRARRRMAQLRASSLSFCPAGDLVGTSPAAMKILSTVAELRANQRNQGRRHVLVPTMGALHAGHVSLIRLARKSAGPTGEVAVSIFVNPLQFEPGLRFFSLPAAGSGGRGSLPRGESGPDLSPLPNEMYATDRSTFVEETALSERLCGASRPGHFRGVCTVVTKLFHLLAPEAAVFGEKDFQQLAIIRRMVRDLDFPIEIIAGPIVREADGLALSSRNQYLSAEERAQAPVIRAALLEAANSSEKSSEEVLTAVRKKIESAPLARIDYAEIVGADDLQPRLTIEPRSLLAVAVFFGRTRLIDNILLG